MRKNWKEYISVIDKVAATCHSLLTGIWMFQFPTYHFYSISKSSWIPITHFIESDDDIKAVWYKCIPAHNLISKYSLFLLQILTDIDPNFYTILMKLIILYFIFHKGFQNFSLRTLESLQKDSINLSIARILRWHHLFKLIWYKIFGYSSNNKRNCVYFEINW